MRYYFTVAMLSLVIGGCSTDRAYTLTHGRMTEAALQAISEEAQVKIADIKRTESGSDGGHRTVLEAPYINYSTITAKIDSRGKNESAPQLEVQITTDKILFTRHKEWEQRIHELVALKLRSHAHGGESKPTALPATPPTVVNEQGK